MRSGQAFFYKNTIVPALFYRPTFIEGLKVLCSAELSRRLDELSVVDNVLHAELLTICIGTHRRVTPNAYQLCANTANYAIKLVDTVIDVAQALIIRAAAKHESEKISAA